MTKKLDLTNFAYAKQQVEEAQAAQREEMTALKEEIQDRYQLKERQSILQRFRETVEDTARRIYKATGKKTLTAVGGKVNVAVKRGPQIIMEDQAIKYIHENHPGMIEKLIATHIDRKAFAKWWKLLDELGEEVPGVKATETATIRITVDKDFKPEPEPMPEIDMETVEPIEY